MTALEIMWWTFWALLSWRQHERPSSRAEHAPAAIRAPLGENRDEPAVASVDRHSGLPMVARSIFRTAFGAVSLVG
jgi:hypothetical protein